LKTSQTPKFNTGNSLNWMQIRLSIPSILKKGQVFSSQSKDRFECFFIAPIKAGSEKLERIAVKVARSVLGRLD